QVNGAVGVQGERTCAIVAAATKIGGKQECGARRVDLGDESVRRAPSVFRLQGVDDREIGGSGFPGNIDVSRAIHRNTKALVAAAAAQVGGVNEGVVARILRIELRYERIVQAAAVGGLQGILGRKIVRIGVACHVHQPACVDGDRVPTVHEAAAKKCRIEY